MRAKQPLIMHRDPLTKEVHDMRAYEVEYLGKSISARSSQINAQRDTVGELSISLAHYLCLLHLS